VRLPISPPAQVLKGKAGRQEYPAARSNPVNRRF
jgi:hypothetical protein